MFSFLPGCGHLGMESRQAWRFSSEDFRVTPEGNLVNLGGISLFRGNGLTKDKKDNDRFKKYMNIKKVVQSCGFDRNEAFRVYEVSNGYIFDMDLNIAKSITIRLAKALENMGDIDVGDGDLIGDNPEKRRKSDMLALAKLCKSEYDKGNRVITVALFSRNSVPNIVISGKDVKGKYISERYNAYAIRHWDIETVNAKLLIPAGFRIYRVEPYEILPSKTGVKFDIYLESCNY